ncbi:hypothetical protein FDE29_24120 [Vibrio parahaemolyticus]|nr:hypothetical protein [Vibrio parahaemolyticus]EGR2568604.1 hypothetical protein [Vibrio parahaemolyticus]EGR3330663.1 hypothetical protein [Vibrio parahaemolyticus]MQC24136.1 hypothetical protein [Vibrio parahaemolyticus]MQC37855.1 hypothetical protein [Vibrio parahaemolyticus]
MAQSRFGSFAFALGFSKMCHQNLLIFKANERLHSLRQFGFQSLSGLLVFQVGLISGLINLRC